MTDYKATPEQWYGLEMCSNDSQPWAPCLLELRARVEALEEDAQEHSASTHFVFDSIIKRLEALEDNFKPTLNSSQIRSSLVTIVSEAINAMADCGDDDVDWQPEARAAICAVVEWLDGQAGGTRAAWMLKKELKQ